MMGVASVQLSLPLNSFEFVAPDRKIVLNPKRYLSATRRWLGSDLRGSDWGHQPRK
jgi:hypothetical protein